MILGHKQVCFETPEGYIELRYAVILFQATHHFGGRGSHQTLV